MSLPAARRHPRYSIVGILIRRQAVASGHDITSLDNHTVYREYATTSMEISQMESYADSLLDHPILFRGKMNQPVLAINAFPIEPIPAERPFREEVPLGAQEAFPAEVPQALKPVKERVRKGIRIILLILLALLVAFACTFLIKNEDRPLPAKGAEDIPLAVETRAAEDNPD